MITEKNIEEAAAELGGLPEEDYASLLEGFQQDHPVVLGYLFAEDTRMLTQSERDMLLYLVLVMRDAYVRQLGAQPPSLGPEALSASEDRNWGLLADKGGRDFRQRLNPFFENSEQEDLLAFFEDMLLEDEDPGITPAGREHVFIAAKSVMDIWCHSKVTQG